MPDASTEQGWLFIGRDEDGAEVYIVPSTVAAFGVDRDQAAVTVVSQPPEESDSFRALKSLVTQTGEEPSYVEQSWNVNLSRHSYAARDFVIRSLDGRVLHGATFATMTWTEASHGSVAEKVLEALVGIVNPYRTADAWEAADPEAGTGPGGGSFDLQQEAGATDLVAPNESLPNTLKEAPCFQGSGSELFGIQILNLFLTIATMGIYSFWGKVRVRKYVWSNTEFRHDTFAYHGTGKELLKGYSRAFLVFGLPLVLLEFASRLHGIGPVPRLIAQFLKYGLIALAFTVATVGARRYRLGRTSWRGIRFSFRGRMLDYVKIFAAGMAATIVTLGFYAPFFDVRRRAFFFSNTFYGNERFQFDGKGRDLLGPFLVAVLLTIPTLGLYWFWYVARKRRYFWGHTRFEGLQFQSTVTGRQLMSLYVGNFLLTVFTLGFGRSLALVRTLRLATNSLRVEGTADFDRIVQEAQKTSLTGEGLADFMDAGFDLG